MCEQTKTNEKKFRLNIKQTSKREPYYEVTVRGDTIEETSENLEKALSLAEGTIKRLDQDKKAKQVLI